MSNNRRRNEEIVETYYGIYPKTFEIVSISRTRGGQLSLWGRDGSIRTHYVAHGRDPRSEVIIVFGLTNIFSVPIQFVDSEHTKKAIKELENKALEMKQQAECQKKKSSDTDDA